MKAINTAKNPGKMNKQMPGGEMGSKSHKIQADSYEQGLSEAGNKRYPIPEGIIDHSHKKQPYGGKAMGWAANSGKLGDLNPSQETDQPAWVNTWSELNTGPGGCGVTIDENYGVRRPRTHERQKDRFAACNSEFQDVADDGDWTSWGWQPSV